MAVECLTEEEPRAVNVLASKTRLHRLVQRAEVSEVKRHGKRIVTDAFVLLYLYNDSDDPYYAIHIRKKFGSSVERNRAKRVFRASLQQLKEKIQGVNLIIIPRRGGKGLRTPQMLRHLEKVLTEVSIPKKK